MRQGDFYPESYWGQLSHLHLLDTGKLFQPWRQSGWSELVMGTGLPRDFWPQILGSPIPAQNSCCQLRAVYVGLPSQSGSTADRAWESHALQRQSQQRCALRRYVLGPRPLRAGGLGGRVRYVQAHGPHPLSPVFTGYKDWSLNRGQQEHQYLLPIKFHFSGFGKTAHISVVSGSTLGAM